MVVASWIDQSPAAAPTSPAMLEERLRELLATLETIVSRAKADADRLLNKEDLATLLRMSARTVTQWDAAGKLPQPVSREGANRWLASEIDAWLKAGMPKRGEWDEIKKAAHRKQNV